MSTGVPTAATGAAEAPVTHVLQSVPRTPWQTETSPHTRSRRCPGRFRAVRCGEHRADSVGVRQPALCLVEDRGIGFLDRFAATTGCADPATGQRLHARFQLRDPAANGGFAHSGDVGHGAYSAVAEQSAVAKITDDVEELLAFYPLTRFEPMARLNSSTAASGGSASTGTIRSPKATSPDNRFLLVTTTALSPEAGSSGRTCTLDAASSSSTEIAISAVSERYRAERSATLAGCSPAAEEEAAQHLQRRGGALRAVRGQVGVELTAGESTPLLV